MDTNGSISLLEVIGTVLVIMAAFAVVILLTWGFLRWLGKGPVRWIVVLLALLFCLLFLTTEHCPVRKASVRATQISITYIDEALNQYAKEGGTFPTEQQGLAVLAPRFLSMFYSRQIPKDAWGNDFRYRLTNGVPQVMSAGPDCIFDTPDDVGCQSPDDIAEQRNSRWRTAGMAVGITALVAILGFVLIRVRRVMGKQVIG